MLWMNDLSNARLWVDEVKKSKGLTFFKVVTLTFIIIIIIITICNGRCVQYKNWLLWGRNIYVQSP